MCGGWGGWRTVGLCIEWTTLLVFVVDENSSCLSLVNCRWGQGSDWGMVGVGGSSGRGGGSRVLAFMWLTESFHAVSCLAER